MHTLSDEDLHVLREVVGRKCDQIVWDINAVYFVFDGRATKGQALADTPHPDHPTDEVMYLAVEHIEPAPAFTAPAESGYWYRVVGENVGVERLELVRTAVVIPGERVAAPTAAPSSAFIADCGVLVHTREGILPAVQLDDTFGFHN